MGRAWSLTLALPLAAVAGCAAPPAELGWSPGQQDFIEAAASQVRRCYRGPKVPSAGRQIITRVRVRYGSDGTLAGLPGVAGQSGITPQNQVYAEPMAEAAIASVIRCSPLRVPAGLQPEQLGEFFLTFSPRAFV